MSSCMAILAAVDGSPGSEKVLTTAYQLSEGLTEELHVIHVMSERRFEERMESGQLLETEWNVPYGDETDIGEEYSVEDAIADSRSFADSIAADTLPEDAAYEPIGSMGDPTSQILSHAESIDASFIVTGGRKRTKIGKVLFGSTSQSILLQATRPIVTVMRED